MNKNTTTTQTEYLSAFLDDEAGKFEQRRLLDEVQKDKELQQKVSNFSLIGEAMRNEKSCVTVQPNFLTGIHDKLDAEPAYSKVHVKKAANQASWLQPVKGMALAASLAAVAVVAINLNNEKQVPVADIVMQQNTTDLIESTASSTDLAKAITVDSYKSLTTKGSTDIKKTLLSATTFHTPDTAWRNRLKHYVNNHTKYASRSAIMPSVRAVSYASSY